VRIIDVGCPRLFVMALIVVAFVVMPLVIMMRRGRSSLASMGYLDLRRSRGRLWRRSRRWPRSRGRHRRRPWRGVWLWNRRWPRGWRTTRTRRRWPTRSWRRARLARRCRPRMRMMMPWRLPQIWRAEPANTEPRRNNSTGIKNRGIGSTRRVRGHSHRNG
jgi:hypothetical protein